VADEPTRRERDERLKINAPFKDTLRALLKTPPNGSAAQRQEPPPKRKTRTKRKPD
jgi:hypothetical protein